MKRLILFLLVLVSPVAAQAAVTQLNALSWAKADGSNQTTNMQRAVNAAATAGQSLFVPPGIVYNAALLTNTANVLIEDYTDLGAKTLRGALEIVTSPSVAITNYFGSTNVTQLADGDFYGREFVNKRNVLWWGAVGDNSTDNAAPIQNAINGTDGDVYIPPGTYWLSDAVEITNSNRRLILDSGALIYCTNATFLGAVIAVSGTAGNVVTNVGIEGGVILHTHPTADENGIGFSHARNVWVQNTTVVTPGHKGITAQEDVSDLRVINNMLDRCETGISIETGCTNIIVLGNIIRGAETNGIDITTGSTACESVQVRDNVIENAGKHGIQTYLAKDLTISGNTIVNPGQHGILSSSSDGVSVSENTVRDSGRHGIYLYNVTTQGSIMLNRISNASKSAANTYDGIRSELCNIRLFYALNTVDGTNHAYAIFTGDAAGLPIGFGNKLTTGVTGAWGGWLPSWSLDDIDRVQKWRGAFAYDDVVTIAPKAGSNIILYTTGRTIVGQGTNPVANLHSYGTFATGFLTNNSGSWNIANKITAGNGEMWTLGDDAVFDANTLALLTSDTGAGKLRLYNSSVETIALSGSSGSIKGSSYEMNSGKFAVDVDGHMRISGNFTAETVTATNGYYAGALPGLTTIYTNMISGVITQRLSFVGGILLTNETLP